MRQGQYFCHECGKSFSQPSHLRTHMRSHTGKRTRTQAVHVHVHVVGRGHVSWWLLEFVRCIRTCLQMNVVAIS